MYRKNTSGQFLCVQLILTATGAVGTGLSPAARRCLDGTFAAGGGTFTEDGTTGSYKYAMSQGDTNANNCSIIVTATGCIPVCVNFITTAADPTDSVRLGLTALPNAAAEASGGLVTRGTGTGQISVTSGQVILQTGTGTGQLDFTSGIVKANVAQLLGTAWLTPGTAGTPDVNVKLWNALATVALPLIPTVAGRTLDCSAGGEAGLDWANVGSPTTTLDLSGTTIKTTQKVDVDTIKTNPVVNAGTITFPTAATLASTTNITSATGIDVTKWLGGTIPAVNVTGVPLVDLKYTLGTISPAAAGSVGIDWAQVANNTSTVALTNTTVGTATTVTNQLTAAAIAAGVWKDAVAGDFTTANSIGKSVMNGVALGTGLTINAYTGNTAQTGDNYARLGAPAGASVSADVAAIKSDSGAVKTKTDSLTYTVAGQVDANIQYVNDVQVNGNGAGTPWGP